GASTRAPGGPGRGGRPPIDAPGLWGDGASAVAATSPPIAGAAPELAPVLAAVLPFFAAQSVHVTSVVALGWLPSRANACGDGAAPRDVALFRIDAGDATAPKISTPVTIPPPDDDPGGRWQHTLDGLARAEAELPDHSPGDRLLLLPARALGELLGSHPLNLGFRAVAFLSPAAADLQVDGDVWRLQRALFDLGLV